MNIAILYVLILLFPVLQLQTALVFLSVFSSVFPETNGLGELFGSC